MMQTDFPIYAVGGSQKNSYAQYMFRIFRLVACMSLSLLNNNFVNAFCVYVSDMLL